jgi:Winged helix domain, variant
MQAEYFTTSLEHILAELERIDLLIRAQIVWRQQRHKFEKDFLRSDIAEQKTDEKIWCLFSFFPGSLASEPLSRTDIRMSIDHFAGDIWLKKSESKRRGIRLRLDELENFFDLSSFERDIFLICLAPEFDLHYERIYAYLQDDVTKTLPEIDFVSDMIALLFSAKQDLHKSLDAEAPLCKSGLLHPSNDQSYGKFPLPENLLKVNEWAVNYLLEVDIIDAEHMLQVQLKSSKNGFKDLAFPAGLKHQLPFIVPDQDVYRQQKVNNLKKPYGIEKQATAAHL